MRWRHGIGAKVLCMYIHKYISRYLNMSKRYRRRPVVPFLTLVEQTQSGHPRSVPLAEEQQVTSAVYQYLDVIVTETDGSVKSQRRVIRRHRRVIRTAELVICRH